MKLFVWDCCAGDGRDGYAAAMVWRSVQVLRPSSSTSAGQSDGAREGRNAVVLGAEWLAGFWDLVICIQSFTLVQVRHLMDSKFSNHLHLVPRTHGLPSLPITTPFGNFWAG